MNCTGEVAVFEAADRVGSTWATAPSLLCLLVPLEKLLFCSRSLELAMISSPLWVTPTVSSPTDSEPVFACAYQTPGTPLSSASAQLFDHRQIDRDVGLSRPNKRDDQGTWGDGLPLLIGRPSVPGGADLLQLRRQQLAPSSVQLSLFSAAAGCACLATTAIPDLAKADAAVFDPFSERFAIACNTQRKVVVAQLSREKLTVCGLAALEDPRDRVHGLAFDPLGSGDCLVLGGQPTGPVRADPCRSGRRCGVWSGLRARPPDLLAH